MAHTLVPRVWFLVNHGQELGRRKMRVADALSDALPAESARSLGECHRLLAWHEALAIPRSWKPFRRR